MKPLLDYSQKQIGTLAVCVDVTENRHLIQKLEDVAGLDPLTGLANRRRVLDAMQEFDHPSNLPISVLLADVNNLKKVNDKFGHQQGDLLLRMVAEVLLTRCPPRALAGRIGGDEFLIVIPQFTPDQSVQLIDEIKKQFAETKGQLFVPSVAIGYAVKSKMEQSFDGVIDAADKDMYIDKRS